MGEQRVLADGRIIEMGPDGVPVVVGMRGGAQGGGMTVPIGPRNPRLPAQVQGDILGNGQTVASTTKTYADIQNDNERLRLEHQRLVADMAAKGLNPDGSPIPGWKPQADKPPVAEQGTIDATTRAKAINQFNGANMLGGVQADLQKSFDAGPGKTSGIAGLLDFLPTQTNQQFNRASDAGRGTVFQALNLIGGQGNTQQEAQMWTGPYIPRAGDYDATIKDSMGRLGTMRDNALRTAIMTLGGVPDANGNIHPIGTPEATNILMNMQAAKPQEKKDPVSALSLINGRTGGGSPPDVNPADFIPGGGGGQGLAPATGERYSTPRDVSFAGVLQQAYNNGATVPQMLDIARQHGYPAEMQNAQQWQTAVDFRDGTGQFKGKKRGLADVSTPQSGQKGLIQSTVGNAALSPAGTAALSSANAMTLGTVDEIAGGINAATDTNGNTYSGLRDYYDYGKNAAFERNPGSAFAGDFVGGAVGGAAIESGMAKVLAKLGARSLPRVRSFLENPVGGAVADGALYGTARGAGEDNYNRLAGAAMGALAGGGGAALGAGTMAGIGGLARGTKNAAKQFLTDRGITLTPGQSMGGPIGWLEEKIGGKSLSDANGYNRAAFNDATDPIGGRVSDLAERGVEQATQLGQNAYQDALGNVALNLSSTDLSNIQGGFAHADQVINGKAADLAAGANYTLNDMLAPILTKAQQGQPLNGDDVQSLLRITGRNAQQYGKLATEGANGIPHPLAQPISDAFSNTNNILRDALKTQAPESASKLALADAAWRKIKTLQNAVSSAKSGSQTGEAGLFGVDQLQTAASVNAKKYGGTHGTTQQPFFDLNENARDILPNRFPNSGTAMRSAALNALTAIPALVGGGGYATDTLDPSTAMGLAALSAMYSKTGRKGLQKVFASTSPTRQSVADRFVAPYIKPLGIAGGALALPALLQGGN